MPISTRLILFASLVASPGVIPLYLFYRANTLPGAAIHGTLGIPSALEDSKLTKLLNPLGNPLMSDSWTYSIRRRDIPWLSSPSSEHSEQDEERVVLARLVRGFYNGKAFAFEQWLFNNFKKPLQKYLRVGFDDPSNSLLATSIQEQETFWSSDKWPIDDYPPYGATYLKAFMLVDSGRDRIYADGRLPKTFSAVAFGSNRPGAQFVDKDNKEEDIFDLNIWSFNCDPSEHGVVGKRPRWLWARLLPTFHYLYERALMADAVDGVRSQ
ncbi:hypothetical protein CALCODRAFT_511972 [Calocera cornea HHB12733]|uniref:Uncharacterized protein n=1 Tax=Calocera cornea HHB12733 TaxID=1353952 RepID=A0A165DDB3_9BASI|nr:hypothetical protein CALCODRAFT_511972 [Calocera cornea HHB12733]